MEMNYKLQAKIMLRIDTAKVEVFSDKLGQFPTALKFAQRNTINDLAFATRTEYIEGMRNELTLRNQWTERGAQVERARRTDDVATVGHTQGYMADTEFGDRRERSGTVGVPIPTATATGEGLTARPRQKAVRPRNRMAKLQLNKTRRKGANRRQQNLIAVKEAVKSGRREVYLDLGRRRGIFRVTGGKRNPRVRMLYDMTRASTPRPAEPLLQDATDKAIAMRDRLYAIRLREQLKRL